MSGRPCKKRRFADAREQALDVHANQERAPPLAQRDTCQAHETDTAEQTRRISPERVSAELPSCLSLWLRRLAVEFDKLLAPATKDQHQQSATANEHAV